MGVTCGEEGTGERRDKVRVTQSVWVQQNLEGGVDRCNRTQSVREDRNGKRKFEMGENGVLVKNDKR